MISKNLALLPFLGGRSLAPWLPWGRRRKILWCNSMRRPEVNLRYLTQGLWTAFNRQFLSYGFDFCGGAARQPEP